MRGRQSLYAVDPGNTEGGGHLLPGTGARIPTRPGLATKSGVSGSRTPGHRNDKDKTLGKPTSAAVQFPTAPLLTIPHVGKETPCHITLSKNSADLATIGEALLTEGILDPSDWTGDLSRSIVSGLERWTGKHFQFHVPQYVDLSLAFTDDSNELMLFGSGWHQHFTKAEDQTSNTDWKVGCFALAHSVWNEGCKGATVGGRIRQLEHAYGKVAFDVLHVLNLALDCTIGAYTPQFALDDVEGRCDNYASAEEAEADDEYTPRTLFTHVPKEACKRRFRPDLLRAAVRRYEIGCTDPGFGLVRILQLAVELAALLKRGRKEMGFKNGYPDQTHLFEDQWPLLPIIVQWSREDCIAALADNHNDMQSQSGSGEFCWIHGFDLSRAGTEVGTVHYAAKCLKWTMEVLGYCERLLSLLDSEESDHKRKRRRSNRLIHVLTLPETTIEIPIEQQERVLCRL